MSKSKNIFIGSGIVAGIISIAGVCRTSQKRLLIGPGAWHGMNYVIDRKL